MIREMDHCPYCSSPIKIGEDSWVVCEYCGREMEITRFTQEEKRLIEVVEDARRSSEAAAEDVRRKVEELGRAHSRETENAVNLARGALETCKSALESVTSQLDRSEARKLRNLYAQAEEAQRAGRFEDAEHWYRQVLISAGNEAEVYWRLVLCSYGIEYVREQASGRYLPTISHMVVDSVLDNADYKAAVRLARSEEIRRFYEDEARHIDGILDKYRQVTATEQPYDVFISVKQGDEDGNPTHDSLVAQDLYYMLTNEFGLKVFNSRISLSQYAGFEYEPYIMAALMRAKVMIVVGTKREYMTSAWVRNEWRRFRWLKDNEDDSRRLIAWVAGMAVREIPREMGDLQAVSASGMGSMDTLRSIMKAAFGDRLNRKNDSDPLLERAAMYLEDGEFDQVDRYCERVLDKDPRNARAYVLKLCARCKVRKESQLAEAREAFDEQGDYKRALRFGDDRLKQRLESYNQAVQKRLEEAEKNREELEAFEAQLRACEQTEMHTDDDVQAMESRIRKLSMQMQEIVGAEPLLERCRRQKNRCQDVHARIQEENRKRRRAAQMAGEELKALADSVRIAESADALAAAERLRKFIRDKNEFDALSNRDALMQECKRLEERYNAAYADLKKEEDEILRQKMQQEKQRIAAENAVRIFEQEQVRTASDAAGLNSRIRQYLEQQNDFRQVDGGVQLLDRCHKRMLECGRLFEELTEKENQERLFEQNRTRQKQVEKIIRGFERESVYSVREAQGLSDRIQRFVEEEEQFRNLEGRAQLLDRCAERMKACVQMIASFREQAEKDVLSFERETVTTAASALNLSNRIQRFMEDQDEFRLYDRGEELLERCRGRMNQCADLYRQLAERAEQDEQERQQRKERRRQAEKKVQAFEKEKIYSAAAALELNSRIQQFVAEQNRFEDYENGGMLLTRCNNRMYECSQIYQELHGEEEKRFKDQQGAELSSRVDGFLREIQNRPVKRNADYRAISDQVSDFIAANNNFYGAANAEELRRRCKTALNKKFAELAGEFSDWEANKSAFEAAISELEQRKIHTRQDAQKLHDDALQYRTGNLKKLLLMVEEGRPYRQRLEKLIADAEKTCERLSTEKPEEPSAPMSAAKKILIALIVAVVCTMLVIAVSGSAMTALISVFLPVFGGVIAFLSGIQAHNQKKTGKVIFAMAVFILWVAYAAYVNGLMI